MFDVIFITQHYVLYRGNRGEAGEDNAGEESRRPLLDEDRDGY